MAVNIEIRQKKLLKKEITIPGIAELKGLSYGVCDENGVLIRDEVGRYTVLYDKEKIGRGFEVWFEDKDILMRLPLPTTAGDIVKFYTLVECLCGKLGVNEFIRDGEKVPAEYCNLFIQQDTDLSINALEDIGRKLLAGESEQFFIFGAFNPVSLGVREINRIAGSMDNFEDLLHELQSTELEFLSPRFFREENGEIYGIYFLDEDTLSAVPLKPYILTDEVEVKTWYAVLPGSVSLKYEDFIANVKKTAEYDDSRILVCLSEEEIYSLAEKSFDIFKGEYAKMYYWGRSLDYGSWHYDKIIKLSLPLDKINGYNHLAAMLFWAAKHDLLSKELISADAGIKEKILSAEDVRNIIHENEFFGGELRTYHFAEEIRDFMRRFYVFNTQSEDGYPYCVDMNAEKYFGEKYDSEEFKNEAYLFVPYDEEYLKNMTGYIDRAYERYKSEENK